MTAFDELEKAVAQIRAALTLASQADQKAAAVRWDGKRIEAKRESSSYGNDRGDLTPAQKAIQAAMIQTRDEAIEAQARIARAKALDAAAVQIARLRGHLTALAPRAVVELGAEAKAIRDRIDEPEAPPP